jgi:hypothetical protein
MHIAQTKRWVLAVLFVTGLFSPGTAQDEVLDSLLQYQLREDSILLDELERMLAEDSITIFDLIDSLSLNEYKLSQLSLRFGYTSNITNAGRNFGIDQHGFGAGVGYYHHTGLFADLSGYWNSDITPHYNPTVSTVGYMGTLTPSWTYNLSYDHYFYRQEDQEENFGISYPLTNALNVSSDLDIRSFTTGVDYAYMFGKANAHRLRGNLMYTFRGVDLWFVERFVFMPGVTAMFGNQEIYNIYPTYMYSRREAIDMIANKIGKRNLIWLYRNNRELFNALLEEFMNNNIMWQEDVDDAFGLMNVSLSAPLYLSIGNFSLLVFYNLNIPIALPGEELNPVTNSYFGCTLMYDIPFIHNSN